MPATLTPLRYPGGKTKYAGLFADIIEMNDLGGCSFAEVFAGGAGAAISLLLKGRVESLLLNDLDVAIYSFWKCVKECPSELTRLIRRTRVSMSEWRRQRATYEARDIDDVLALAFSTFFLNRCNHSGILGARPIGGMNQDGTYRIHSRFNKATAIAKIEAIADRAASIEVFNLDGVDFLNYLQQRHHGGHCLIYLDPPYYQKGPGLYLNHFTHENHAALRDAIVECPFPWVLSYDDHREVVDLYGGRTCKLYRNHLRHTVAGNAEAEELIISRLNLPEYLEPLSGRATHIRRARCP